MRTFSTKARLLFLGFIFAIQTFGMYSAMAADLTWEKGGYQEIEIDNLLVPNIASLQISNNTFAQNFYISSQSNNRTIYQVKLSPELNNGDYQITLNYGDGRSEQFATVQIVDYQSGYYNPALDVKTVTTTSVTLFTLLTVWSLSDSASRKREDENDSSRADIGDVNTAGLGAKLQVVNSRKSFLPSIYLDQLRNLYTIDSSRFSPLLSRLISVGGYLQYLFGSLVLIFPIASIAIGAIAFNDIRGIGQVSTPSLWIAISMIVLGALDAGSAFIGATTFAFLCVGFGLIGDAYDLRTLLGLMVLWFTPSLIANATRGFRRKKAKDYFWERTGDVIIGSVLTAWAIKGLVNGLNGLAHLYLPLAKHADLLAIIAGASVATRYLIEELVINRSPNYLAYVSPKELHEHDAYPRFISWILRAFLYLFLSVSFFGLSWQLYIALGLFLFPLILSTVKDNFPNFPLLYQLIPTGIPAIIIMTIFGKFYGDWISTWNLPEADKSKMVFLYMAIPGFILTTLKAFGRSAKAGDQRWYMRDSMNIFYKIVGPIAVAIAISMTMGIISV